jgi:hypothetical protein
MASPGTSGNFVAFELLFARLSSLAWDAPGIDKTTEIVENFMVGYVVIQLML